MTTMAALLGACPWPSAADRVGAAPALGIAIVGGLLFSQLLTLFTTPVVYLYLDRFRARLAAVRRKLAGRFASRGEKA